MRPVVVAALALLATTSYPRIGGACDPVPNDGGAWTTDPAYATDVVPPSAVTATATVYQGDADPDRGGCSDPGEPNYGTCGAFPGRIALQLSATDDASGTDVGYRFTVASGQPPAELRGADGMPLRPWESGGGPEISLTFDRNAGPFSFELEIRAIDKNGNAGAPTVLHVEG